MFFSKCSVYVVVGLSLLLGGCVSYGRVVSHDAIQFNKAYERYSNEEILLNIIRGSKNRPMKFTTLSQVQGSLTVSVGSNSMFSLGPETAGGRSISPTLTVSKNPSFTLANQNRDQAFMNGILTAIPATTLRYFISQGWKEPLLFNLLFDRIEIKVDEVAVCTFTNADDGQATDDESCRCESANECYAVLRNNPNFYREFKLSSCDEVYQSAAVSEPRTTENTSTLTLKQRRIAWREICGFLRVLEKIDPEIQATPSFNQIGPLFTTSDAALIKSIASATKEKLSVRLNERKCPPSAESPSELCSPEKGVLVLGKGGDRIVLLQRSIGERSAKLDCPSDLPGCKSLANKVGIRVSLDESEPQEIARFELRSTQGVLYYLGELLDARQDKQKEQTICRSPQNSNDLWPKHYSLCSKSGGGAIFVAEVTDVGIQNLPFVSTKYEDQQYVVPAHGSHSSSTALAIVDYLIGLNVKAENLPVTRNVNIIGN